MLLQVQMSQPAPPVKRALLWLRANLFSSVASTLVTLVLVYLIAYVAIRLFQWGVVHAVWAVPDNHTQACRSVRGLGACWAVVREKHRFILFGLTLLRNSGGLPWRSCSLYCCIACRPCARSGASNWRSCGLRSSSSLVGSCGAGPSASATSRKSVGVDYPSR